MSRAGEKAWEVIRDGILRGTYSPGEHLKEEELAAQAGVSRTPVREALRRLIREGLVEHAPNVGTRVIRWTEKELEDVFELRALLEGHAAARAAMEISSEQLAELRRLASEMESLAAQGGEDVHDPIAQRNRSFHRLILEVGGGPRLGDLLSTVVSIPVLLRTFRRYTDHELRRSMQHHRELIESIEAGDGVWARAVMQAHLRAALNVIRSRRPDSGVQDGTPTERKQTGAKSEASPEKPQLDWVNEPLLATELDSDPDSINESEDDDEAFLSTEGDAPKSEEDTFIPPLTEEPLEPKEPEDPQT